MRKIEFEDILSKIEQKLERDRRLHEVTKHSGIPYRKINVTLVKDGSNGVTGISETFNIPEGLRNLYPDKYDLTPLELKQIMLAIKESRLKKIKLYDLFIDLFIEEYRKYQYAKCGYNKNELKKIYDDLNLLQYRMEASIPILE